MAESQLDLSELRKALDSLDDRLLDLLNERARIVEQVAEYKQSAGVPFYVPDRERRIIERLTARNAGPFPNAGIRPVVQEVISACLSLEKGVKVAYLGPEGTFTHLAVLQRFGSSARGVPCGSIAAVFDEVERGQADYGVVPVENSSEGVVSHTLDSFIDAEAIISGEILVAVSHSLLARHGLGESQIERVFSHPQALGQCRQWLEANLPNAVQIESSSTADAARHAHSDHAAAAIASDIAARTYDLTVLRSEIQDSPDNHTRFLVISSPTEPQPPSGDDKTSISLMLGNDAGSLYTVLEPLSRAGINLTKIESRPTKRKAWQYVFFLDIDGHIDQPEIAQALDQARGACDWFRVLGSYRQVHRARPASTDVDGD